MNSVNFNNINNGGQVRRSMKKRNTVAYTTPIFNNQLKNKLKQNIQENNTKINSPKFLGLLIKVILRIEMKKN